MRAVTIPMILVAGTAEAHPGHIAEVAGHGHWVAGAAIGLAVLAGLWSKWKDREADSAGAADAEDEEGAEPEEQTA